MDLPPIGPLTEFLLAFPALFSIVNPIAAALIFREATLARSKQQRAGIARRVALYSLIVMLGALWGGSYVLSFFGITLAALRIAGGVVVALFAWNLMNAGGHADQHAAEQQQPSDADEDIAFFPLTLPVTTGPGTISVAIALGAQRPHMGDGVLAFMLGATLAAVAMSAVIWTLCASATRLAALLGRSGGRIVTRLSAFLLLCIGVQILITGIAEMLAPVVVPHP